MICNSPASFEKNKRCIVKQYSNKRELAPKSTLMLTRLIEYRIFFCVAYHLHQAWATTSRWRCCHRCMEWAGGRREGQCDVSRVCAVEEWLLDRVPDRRRRPCGTSVGDGPVEWAVGSFRGTCTGSSPSWWTRLSHPSNRSLISNKVRLSTGARYASKRKLFWSDRTNLNTKHTQETRPSHDDIPS
jgi:hypothetical protein